VIHDSIALFRALLGERRHVFRSRASRLLLVAVAWVLLRPLAAASPPDPTWIAGVYDDGDLDDIVIHIGGLVGVTDTPDTVQHASEGHGGALVLPAGARPSVAPAVTLLDRSPPLA